jgi:hypothetical protein
MTKNIGESVRSRLKIAVIRSLIQTPFSLAK